MSTSKKALALARVLQDNLTIRLGFLATPLTVVASTDTNGNPVLSVGTISAGQQGAVIRVLPVAQIGNNALGSAQESYTPHTIQVCTESTATAGTDLLLALNALPIHGEVLRTGTRVELYQTANGTPPSTSAMIAANLIASFDNLNFSLIGAM